MRYVYPKLPKLDDIKKEIGILLDQGKATMCDRVPEFERAVSELLGVRFVLGFSNATTALILLLQNLKKGDVLVPSWTFHATLAALAWNGLNPVYVDIDPDDFTMDVEDAERKITTNTVAILPVNIFGLPPDVKDLEVLSEEYKLPVFYDSSQGLGSMFDGKLIGGFGDAEVFSLSATKPLCTGEGGILTTDSYEIYLRMKAARHWGDHGGHDTSTQNPAFPGLNGHMTEFEAILGKWGLKDLSYRIGERVAMVNRYKELLGDSVMYQKITCPRTTNYKDFIILVPTETREKIVNALLAEGVETKKYFYPCHLTEAYWKDVKLPVTEEYSCRSICLPLHHKMTTKDLEIVSHTILENL